MIQFPHCKINLGLSVLGKRADGFHNLETVFHPLPLTDVLEIIPAPNSEANGFAAFSATGIPVAGDPQTNLCLKAYHLLKEGFPQLPSIHMHLHKSIPIGAGLGGGSSDGAFTLRLMNDLFSLQLTTNELLQLAARLGSDCAFFVLNKPCLAKGRGEVLEEITLDLDSYQFVLVCPDIHINTGWAFSQLALQPYAGSAMAIAEAVRQPVTEWKGILFNDFERPVFQQYPAIEQVKNRLYEQGALYASMSGSGSSVYGIFDRPAKPDPALFAGHRVYFL